MKDKKIIDVPEQGGESGGSGSDESPVARVMKDKKLQIFAAIAVVLAFIAIIS